MAKVETTINMINADKLLRTLDFLKDYMQLRKQQKEYFKKRSKSALIFCKEAEPALDAKATELYQLLTEPKLFNEEG